MCSYGVGPRIPVHSSSRAGLLAGSERSGIGGLPHVARVSRENVGYRVYTAQGNLERISGMHACVGGRDGVNVHSFARWHNTPLRPALSLQFGHTQNPAVLQVLGTLGCWLLCHRGCLHPLSL